MATVCALPMLGIETQCRSPQRQPASVSRFGITDAGYARPEGDSFLTFPEWYIVYASRA